MKLNLNKILKDFEESNLIKEYENKEVINIIENNEIIDFIKKYIDEDKKTLLDKNLLYLYKYEPARSLKEEIKDILIQIKILDILEENNWNSMDSAYEDAFKDKTKIMFGRIITEEKIGGSCWVQDDDCYNSYETNETPKKKKFRKKIEELFNISSEKIKLFLKQNALIENETEHDYYGNYTTYSFYLVNKYNLVNFIKDELISNNLEKFIFTENEE